MGTIFLNIKTNLGTETVDEFTREENQTLKEFKKYINHLINEYQIAGINVYKSSRSTNGWRNKQKL
jgi:hypothetical protein